MADDVGIRPDLEPGNVQVATDEIAGRHYQVIKQAHGADGVATLVQDTNAARFPVGGAALGNPDDATAGSDTATASQISLAKRLLQRITALIALFPAALTSNGGAMKVGSTEVVITQSVAVGQTVPAAGVDLAGLRNWGIVVPGSFDGTDIKFQTCDTLGGTYVPVFDMTNTEVRMTVGVGRFFDVPGELMALRFLKITTVTAQAGTATDFLIIGKS